MGLFCFLFWCLRTYRYVGVRTGKVCLLSRERRQAQPQAHAPLGVDRLNTDEVIFACLEIFEGPSWQPGCPVAVVAGRLAACEMGGPSDDVL